MLDLYNVPYETVDVNPLTKGEIKSWSGGYKKVPIALLGGADGTEAEQVNDSPVIAATLLDRMCAGGAISKAELEHFRSPAALEWAEWSDSKLAVLLFPNITRNFGEAFQAFSYVMEVTRAPPQFPTALFIPQPPPRPTPASLSPPSASLGFSLLSPGLRQSPHNSPDLPQHCTRFMLSRKHSPTALHRLDFPSEAPLPL